jgi:hypothetical protein
MSTKTPISPFPTQDLESLLSLLDSESGLASLTETEAVELEESFGVIAIELAERRASPKQLALQRAFFARQDNTGRRCKVFVALGGNRSGKSFGCGWMCFCKYLRDVAVDGDLFWCVAQTEPRSIGGQQKEIWEALPRWMFGEQAWDPKIGFGGHNKIVLKLPPQRGGGSCVVEFRGCHQAPSTFEQAKLAGAWMDERVSEEIYNRIIPRTLDKDAFILYSDIPEQWWQFERLKEAAPEVGVYFVQFGMQDNASNLAPNAVEMAKLLMTQEEQTLRIVGDFVVMEGVVYKQFLDWHERDGGHLVTPFPIPKDWPKVRLIDYGGTSPTACLWGAIADNEHIYFYREHYDRGHSVGYNARLILQASGDEEYRLNLIDPAAYSEQPGLPEQDGEIQTIAMQYESGGIKPIRPWPRVNEMGEHAMVQKVKYRLENFTVWYFENLVNLRREKRSWKHKCDKDGKPLAADAYENANNHLLDCEKGFMATNPTFVVPVGWSFK